MRKETQQNVGFVGFRKASTQPTNLGLPRIYIAPELDQETGSKIESIHKATSRPRPSIIKEAVDLLYNKLNGIPSVAVEKPRVMTHAGVTLKKNSEFRIQNQLEGVQSLSLHGNTRESIKIEQE